MSRHKIGLSRAMGAMSNSDFHKQKLGCALIYRKYTLSVGWNSSKTSPVQKQYNVYRDLVGDCIKHAVHAEIMALEAAKHFDVDWNKVTLYVYREHANGNPAKAMPCPACMQRIKDVGIKTVVYTDSNERGYTVMTV